MTEAGLKRMQKKPSQESAIITDITAEMVQQKRYFATDTREKSFGVIIGLFTSADILCKKGVISSDSFNGILLKYNELRELHNKHCRSKSTLN